MVVVEDDKYFDIFIYHNLDQRNNHTDIQDEEDKHEGTIDYVINRGIVVIKSISMESCGKSCSDVKTECIAKRMDRMTFRDLYTRNKDTR